MKAEAGFFVPAHRRFKQQLTGRLTNAVKALVGLSALLDPLAQHQRQGKGVKTVQVQKPQNLDNSNWPDKGYVLAFENDKALWPYLESSLIRDGYEALSPEQLKEGRDVR